MNVNGNDVLLKVDGVSKKFCRDLRRSLWYGLQDAVRSSLGLPVERNMRKGEFNAVEDVSFELRRGEVLGVAGLNGSGKTTLMRMIAGIFPCDSGRVIINGRVSVVFATTLGMHPHYTGRENVYLMAAMHGLTRDEIENRMDAILEFAGIGDHIDRPFGMYSSGMKSRLGYAVAFSSDPDLFISDEGIAVGDVAFKEKCYNHIRSLAKDKSVIFVSSSVKKIQRVASQVLVLDEGKMVFHSNDVERGVQFYREQVLQREESDDEEADRPRTKAHARPSQPKGSAANLELVSIHIPKTAGTTFRTILQQQYSAERVARLDINQRGKIKLNREIILHNTLPESVKVIHGHFTYGDLMKRFNVSEEIPVVTWLRHPVTRVYSAYAYYRDILASGSRQPVPRYVETIMKGGSLMEFAIHDWSRNRMSYYLDGIELDRLLFVGLQEYFAEDVGALSSLLGWKLPVETSLLNSTITPREPLSGEVFTIIAELNKADMKLYERALALRNARINGRSAT
jgi:lipopolysaccharide transport system ATP-binding protein